MCLCWPPTPACNPAPRTTAVMNLVEAHRTTAVACWALLGCTTPAGVSILPHLYCSLSCELHSVRHIQRCCYTANIAWACIGDVQVLLCHHAAADATAGHINIQSTQQESTEWRSSHFLRWSHCPLQLSNHMLLQVASRQMTASSRIKHAGTCAALHPGSGPAAVLAPLAAWLDTQPVQQPTHPAEGLHSNTKQYSSK